MGKGEGGPVRSLICFLVSFHFRKGISEKMA